MRHEILTTHAPVPEQVLEEIVDQVFLPLVRRSGRGAAQADVAAPS